MAGRSTLRTAVKLKLLLWLVPVLVVATPALSVQGTATQENISRQQTWVRIWAKWSERSNTVATVWLYDYAAPDSDRWHRVNFPPTTAPDWSQTHRMSGVSRWVESAELELANGFSGRVIARKIHSTGSLQLAFRVAWHPSDIRPTIWTLQASHSGWFATSWIQIPIPLSSVYSHPFCQDDSCKKQVLLSYLFASEPAQTTGNYGDNRSYECNGRTDWKHAGWDSQTLTVAGDDPDETDDEYFYSLTTGVVTRAEDGTGLGTIAIYDKHRRTTVVYLHARAAEVVKDETVWVGKRLGIQGGYPYLNGSADEHVHVEVRTGERTRATCGQDRTTSPPIGHLYAAVTGR